MSHQTTVEVEITEIDSLRTACKEMGFEMIDSAQARGYGSKLVSAEHVIRLPGRYDIAVKRRPDGKFDLETDFWGGDVVQVVGEGCGRLMQMYGVNRAEKVARRRGLRTRREAGRRGEIHLKVRGFR